MPENQVPDEVLLDRLLAGPVHGRVYRHYRTKGLYRVVGCAIHEATQEPLVIYQSLSGLCLTFARPQREWTEEVTHEGAKFHRFELIEE